MRGWLKSNRFFLILLLGFGLFRSAVADWNPIPSGSMRPTLLEGDVVLVNRLAYQLKLPLTDHVLMQWRDPVRGEVVVFASPKDGTRLIKRIVGLPGDVVAMRDNRLSLNGRTLDYAMTPVDDERMEPGPALRAVGGSENLQGAPHRLQWLPDVASRSSFGPVRVPSGEYLMLGDNRDNSADSRYFGFVPRELLSGRAERILVSAAFKDDWHPRWDRFGQPLH